MSGTKGHSTTASIKVSKTLDRGSIPRAPAIIINDRFLPNINSFQIARPSVSI